MDHMELYQQIIRGLEQYLWFLGQDTKGRNLLVEFGFQKHQAQDHGGSSRYTLKFGHRIIELHSFCAGIYGDSKKGFLYVRAHNKAYVYHSLEAPAPGKYPLSLMTSADEARPRDFYTAIGDFLHWLERYESWIEEKYGKQYRINCYARYHKKWFPPAKARSWFRSVRLTYGR